MTRRPLFIVFEGIDGSGKSTQCDLLYEHVRSSGISAVRLAEPTGGVWGRKVREMLSKKEMAPAEEQMRLFLMDRKDDAEKNIAPAMESGRTIIMDRYYFSNAAYQGAAGIDPGSIIAENRAMRFPEPDRVYFIDIPPEVAIRRVSGRSGKREEVFEKEAFLKKVRDIFLSIADNRFLVIDGTKSIDGIFSSIKEDFASL
ncbi:MAG TPA: dTMP kinase [Spirochaetota bacterium]|nr:dTMP kinase [Spirochaetota bacterium]HOD16552.1 dTMP kinase [Spirochaetota bacterium]HPG51313.1 dTMP kinase [Spirochaetota bacterium]HPN10696.1 dTMP kinase [Spirochaetota bacterium]HQL83377.1 dTMP kinase [Spirochaetota bacterium]